MKPLDQTNPARVGPYTLLAELGKGAMGRVLLGHDDAGRLVAVKLMRPQFTEDDGFRARFALEVTASRKVAGAHTAGILDADPAAPTPWFASTYEPGPSLREAVAATGPLPEAAALRLAAGLASALVAIHRAGLVHRDLKPSNVLLTEQGPKVIDFGIARATDSPGGTDITHTGWLIGTPGYMSPEQAEGAKVGPISDVFALGSVLAMACTGTGPFDGSSAPQTLYKVVHTEPDLSEVPERVRRIIELCLVKDPAKRPTPERVLAAIGPLDAVRVWPESVRGLIAAQDTELRELLDGRGDGTTLLDNGETLRFAAYAPGAAHVPPPPPPPPPPIPRPVPPPIPRKQTDPAHIFGVLAVLAVVALIIWSIASPDDGDSTSDSGNGVGAYDDNTPEDVYTPPENDYTPPEDDYTPPEEEPFDYDSLNDEDTDETSMTDEALLPSSFDDFTQSTGKMHPCGDAYFDGTAVEDALTGAGCDEIAIGTYLDDGNDIVVALMVIPLSDDDTAEDSYDRALEGYTDDWTMWCPKKPAAGWRPCVEDTSYATNTGRVGVQYRYLMMARAYYTDLSDGGESALTDATTAAIDAVTFGE